MVTGAKLAMADQVGNGVPKTSPPVDHPAHLLAIHERKRQDSDKILRLAHVAREGPVITGTTSA